LNKIEELKHANARAQSKALRDNAHKIWRILSAKGKIAAPASANEDLTAIGEESVRRALAAKQARGR